MPHLWNTYYLLIVSQVICNCVGKNILELQGVAQWKQAQHCNIIGFLKMQNVRGLGITLS